MVVVLVVAVAGTAEAGVDTSEAELVAAEVEWASADPASVVAQVTTIAEACALLIRVLGSFVPRFVARPPLWERIAG